MTNVNIYVMLHYFIRLDRGLIK